MEGVNVAITYWLFLLAAVAGPATARFVVETNSLSVVTPESLKGNYDSAIGNFGVPQYGGTMSGRAIYPTENTLACQEFTSSSSFRSHAGERPNMVLVDRGDCYFALKVWNAQKAGAAAVLVADDRDEPLLTMDTPAEDDAATQYLDNITVPSALLSKAFGDRLRATLQKQEMVTITLDWRESLPHPDDRVEYEFWTNSNDECGQKCDDQVDFVRDFRGAAQILERGGYTLFTPHYITWYCPESFVQTQQCKSQCINNGRYCTPDPEQDFSIGYEGKDVLMENLRQLCVYRIANQTKTPWVWWDYVTDFHLRCPMKEQKFNQNCAEEVLKSLGLDAGLVRNCMGNPDADAENPVLKAEQDAQVGQGTRGDVTMLPTLLVNNRQYRGKLERGAVLKAICSGFEESTEPSVCLTSDMETNECMENNGGCWKDANSNITACKDTFRGRVCVCPLVNGVQFHGDGYTKCDPSGVGRCQIKNGGCWQDTKNDKSFSACQDSMQDGCKCPDGFKGDGVSRCDDIDECKEKTACQCPECNCKDTWGSFECTCSGDLLYMKEQDTCISKGPRSSSKAAWVITTIVILALAAVGVGAYVIYKYRLRSYMDSEIRAIMAQYMPLDNQGGVQHLDNDP